MSPRSIFLRRISDSLEEIHEVEKEITVQVEEEESCLRWHIRHFGRSREHLDCARKIYMLKWVRENVELMAKSLEAMYAQAEHIKKASSSCLTIFYGIAKHTPGQHHR